MEALIKMVVEKTGISQDQATSAVNTVVDFLKDKLPAGIGQHLDSFVNGESSASSGLGDITDKIGDMFT
jgi:nucleoid DNA-binding protein